MLFGSKLLRASWLCFIGTFCFFQASVAQESQNIITSHAIAMHGDIKYLKQFSHFNYVNPNAPKGGKLKLGGFGTYDSFNPFLNKGVAPSGIEMIYDTLTAQSSDEAFTQYGLIANEIIYPTDRSWVIYKINPRAKFSDGKPVTAEDVVFSFYTLRDQGAVYYASYYADVKEVKALDKLTVKYQFKHNKNKELALIVGQLPVLPKHFWHKHHFATDTLVVPVGSGPYQIKSYDLGRHIVYERNKNYWAKNHPVNKGRYNFEQIRVDYYKDSSALLEAFKSGQLDFRYENSSKQWATGYQSNALSKGWFIKETIDHSNPTGMQAFILNLSKPIFQDVRVRKALNYAFDFEWTNKQLFYGAYARNNSYFENSELASSGLPKGEELVLLNNYKDKLPEEVFTRVYASPVSNAGGYNRKNLLIAKQLLENAGWKVKNNILVNANNQPFSFEITLVSPAFERIVNPYVKALKKLGIQANVRIVEAAQFIHRMRLLKYDMIVHTISQSLSPGNEQHAFWHSSVANKQGTYNYSGIQNEVVDALVGKIINASNRQDLVTSTRALDRVLLHHYFTIPQWHSRNHRIAYWNKFSRPATAPKYDVGYETGLTTWWFDKNKAAILKRDTGQ